MVKLHKPKLYLHIFMPVTTVFILNNLYLLTLDTPGYLMINLVTFGTVVTFSILSLRNLSEKELRVESQDSLNLSIHELSDDARAIGGAYSDLKKLLVVSCQKNSLPMAKELAKICSELGPAAADLNEKFDNLKTPRERSFKQGSLRNAYNRGSNTPERKHRFRKSLLAGLSFSTPLSKTRVG